MKGGGIQLEPRCDHTNGSVRKRDVLECLPEQLGIVLDGTAQHAKVDEVEGLAECPLDLNVVDDEL